MSGRPGWATGQHIQLKLVAVESFWHRLARHRESIGLSQAIVAERLGVTQQRVSDQEQETGTPENKRWGLLAEAYEINLDTLGGWAVSSLRVENRGLKRQVADTNKLLKVALEELQESRRQFDAGLSEIKRFSDTYQAFHASYERMGQQLDVLVGEMAEIKRIVLDDDA